MLEAWRRQHQVRFGSDKTIAWVAVPHGSLRARKRRPGNASPRQALVRIAQLAPPATEDFDRQLVDDERLRQALDMLAGL
jgi:hypothetical protein